MSAGQPGGDASNPAAAPVTEAARSAAQARSPLPPSPNDPRPVPSRPATASAAERGSQAETAAARAGASAAASPIASRAVRRSVDASASAAPRQTPRAGSARAAAGTIGGGRKDYRGQRSPARTTLLVVGGGVALVLLLVLAVSVLKGGGGQATSGVRTSTGAASTTNPRTVAHRSSHQPVAAKPSEIAVAVLNGTSTVGLAHHLAADLQQSGYTQALASAAVPPGTHQTTVVQYAGGHRADAQAVAKALDVTQVQPLEAGIAAQAGSAAVVVLAGADQAALLGGGGAQSQGEPAAGQ